MVELPWPSVMVIWHCGLKGFLRNSNNKKPLTLLCTFYLFFFFFNSKLWNCLFNLSTERSGQEVCEIDDNRTHLYQNCHFAIAFSQPFFFEFVEWHLLFTVVTHLHGGRNSLTFNLFTCVKLIWIIFCLLSDPCFLWHVNNGFRTYLFLLVGYILGLGDRHVHNILIDEQTAELVHIDLGKWDRKDSFRFYLLELLFFFLNVYYFFI